MAAKEQNGSGQTQKLVSLSFVTQPTASRCSWKRGQGACAGGCGSDVEPVLGTGRYYIAMGHPGFNSPANNGGGYASWQAARQAVQRYSRKGAK